MVLLDTYHVCLFCLGTVFTSYNTCWNDLDTSHACLFSFWNSLEGCLQPFLCFLTPFMYV